MQTPVKHTYEVYMRVKNGLNVSTEWAHHDHDLAHGDAELIASLKIVQVLNEFAFDSLVHFDRRTTMPDADLPDHVRGRFVLRDRRILTVRIRITTPVMWSLVSSDWSQEFNAGIVPLHDLKNKATNILQTVAGTGARHHWHGLSADWDPVAHPWWEVAGTDALDGALYTVRVGRVIEPSK